MKAVKDKSIIQIEITNACANECANCTRFVGHHHDPYFMELGMIARAIDSLEGFQHHIGIMGGEPTKHPEFEKICELLQKKVPKEKRSLHTSGYKWNQYRSIIRKTFGVQVHLNNHTNLNQRHHPMLLALGDVVSDRKIADQLIDHCWVNERWSASINPKGCFFCEMAASLDLLFDGPGGMPIQKGWYNHPPHAFADQKANCYQCGACVPFRPVRVKENRDYVSVSNYQRLKAMQTPRFKNNRVKLVRGHFNEAHLQKFSKEWQPWNHWADGEKKLNSDDLYGRFFGFAERLTLKFRRIPHRVKRIWCLGSTWLKEKHGAFPPSHQVDREIVRS